MKRHIFAAAFGALMVVLPVRYALRADAVLYTVEDLGHIDGLAPIATGMNASGHLSGYVTGASGFPQAVRYTPASGWQYVPGVSSFYSQATGINDQGDLVGTHHNGAAFRAFRYVEGPGASFIDPLPGGLMTYGLAIDAAGNVFGQSDTPEGPRGFRAAVGLPALALPGLGGPAAVCGVNAAGQLAGYGVNGTGQHGFRIEADNTTVTPIVPFSGPDGTAFACAIDATGRVGGQATHAGAYRAFVFDSGAPVNVDAFANSEQSKVESIARGVAVGWFLSTADGPRAFVNTADGSADLNTLIAPGSGWQLDQAFVVDASGTIVGVGRLNGQARAFRLTRVESGDTTAPVIASVSATPASIALPNNSMVTVNVAVAVTDDTDPAPVCSVTGIDGHGAPVTDFMVTGPLSGWVRARGGATYSFAVSCADAAGNAATGSVDVVVPPDTAAPVISDVSATPSTVWPPNGALVPVTVNVAATDNVDASPSCSLSSVNVIPTSGPDDYATTGPLSAKLRAVGGRTYTLVVTCRDTAGNQSSAAVAVVVPPDTKAPVIESVVASPGSIWPPNGKMVNVHVAVSATDDVDALPQCSVKAVLVSGGVSSDGVVTGTFTASVRAEKDRSYTVKVVCRDAAGNASYGSTSVVVSNKDTTSAAKKILQAKALVALLKKAAAGKSAAKANAKRYFSRGSSR